MKVDGSSSEVGVSQRSYRAKVNSTNTFCGIADYRLHIYSPFYCISSFFWFFDLREYVSIIFSFYLYSCKFLTLFYYVFYYQGGNKYIYSLGICDTIYYLSKKGSILWKTLLKKKVIFLCTTMILIWSSCRNSLHFRILHLRLILIYLIIFCNIIMAKLAVFCDTKIACKWG